MQAPGEPDSPAGAVAATPRKPSGGGVSDDSEASTAAATEMAALPDHPVAEAAVQGIPQSLAAYLTAEAQEGAGATKGKGEI